jgi:hypothetical protein
MKFEIPNVRCPHCSPSAQADGSYHVGKSFWRFCRAHRTNWLAGWDDDIDDNKDEQQRRYDELGIAGFEHVGKEAAEAMAARTAKLIVPAFAFARRRDIEIETGLILAGNLVVDIPKDAKPKRKQMRLIKKIVEDLTAEARAGRMADDAVVYGWPHGCAPDGDIDHVAIDLWAQTRVMIAVRVDPRNDGRVRIDSDIAFELGLVKKQ